jgi:CheY-like chemotaxis protein
MKRVLVVDDDRDMVQTLCDILELHGWETFRGYDGEAAVLLSEAHGVNLLLMDVRMPRLSGVDAWRRIFQRRPAARSVLMTAYAPPEALALVEGQGVVRILRKPIDVPEMMSALEQARQQVV